MDGELRIIWQSNDEFDKIVATMDPKICGIVTKMRNPLTPLGVWELKSLAAGSDDVMKAVHDLDNFPWTFHSEDQEVCNLLEAHWRSMGKVRDTVIGRDAQSPMEVGCRFIYPRTGRCLLIFP